MTAIIRTVTGDIDPMTAGPTYLHEHLIIDSAIVMHEFPEIHLCEIDAAVNETRDLKRNGIGTLVDCMPFQSGGSPEKLRVISAMSGLNIVFATGMHNKKYYEENVYNHLTSGDVLREKMIDEINKGIGPEKIQCGIIKVAAASESMTREEEVVFESAISAHKVCGAPILTHCESGNGAIEQIEFFQKSSMPLASVVLSHTDKVADLGYHKEILGSGVNVEYDQSLRQLHSATKPSAKLTIKMIEAGFIDQIMLGTDGARRSLWKSHGGNPGLSGLFLGWKDVLKDMGASPAHINQIFIENPQRFLAFEPQ